jgi:hypothetical protein
MPTTHTPRTDARPSSRQVYYVARLLVDAAGIEWPESRAAMSQLIERLQPAPAATPDEAPF